MSLSKDANVGRTALVLYGSETGNAQDVAEELSRVVQRLRFSTLVLSLDSIDPSVLAKYSLVLIAVSTTGQGEFPANSRAFWKKLLRKKLPTDYLAGVDFALFGLGDSSYPKFNWAALKLFKRLVQLGAHPVHGKGEGDEQHPEGIDSIFCPWSKDLRQQVLKAFPLSKGLEPIGEDVLLQPQWLLDFAGNRNGALENGTQDKHLDGLPSDQSGKTLDVTLEANERITAPTHWQDVRHLKFKSDEVVEYAPGDILTVYPENSREDVDQVLTLLKWQDIADEALHFRPNKDFHGTMATPCPAFSINDKGEAMSMRSLLTHHLDLNAIPKRSFFSLVHHFTGDEFQKTRLQEFADPQYTDELFDYTTRPRRSILEVLQEFDTLEIPWQWAAATLPPLRGRQFSIASGGELKSDGTSTYFELLVAIVKYKTVIRKIRHGTCTRYLEGLPLHTRLQVTLVKGSLGITNDDARRPTIMIGPGTGVAPIRSLIWERRQLQRITLELMGRDPSSHPLYPFIGPNFLFFGCRSKDSDYFFQDEWSELVESHFPLQIFPAFSRDQQSKVYVQDLVREHRDEVFDLLHEHNGIAFVCGSSGKMPTAVRDALVGVFEHGLSSDRDTANTYLQALEKQGRYKQETW